LQGLGFKVRVWIMGLRPFTYPWIAVNTLLGVSLAGFDPAVWLKAFAIVTLILSGAHFFNSWIDYVRGLDKPVGGSKPKPYTAGSQILPQGWLSLRTVQLSTFALWGLGFALALAFTPWWRLDVLAFMALGMLCAVGYSLWLKVRGFGEVALFLGHGVATVCYSYAVVKPVDLTAVAAGSLAGFWAATLYTLDQWQDVETDFAARVKNIAYLMFSANMKPSELWYFTITGSYTLQFGFILLRLLPAETLLTLLMLPVAHVIGMMLDYRFEKGILLMLLAMWLYALLASLGVLLSGYIPI